MMMGREHPSPVRFNTARTNVNCAFWRADRNVAAAPNSTKGSPNREQVSEEICGGRIVRDRAATVRTPLPP